MPKKKKLSILNRTYKIYYRSTIPDAKPPWDWFLSGAIENPNCIADVKQSAIKLSSRQNNNDVRITLSETYLFAQSENGEIVYYE